MNRLSAQQQDRASLLHGSLTYRDERLKGRDAAVAMEVIEHMDPSRLDAFEDAVFAHARPGKVVITTPPTGSTTPSSGSPKRVDSGRGQNRTLRPLSAFWPPVFAGEQDVSPPKGRDVGQELGLNGQASVFSLSDRFVEMGGIPVNDNGGE